MTETIARTDSEKSANYEATILSEIRKITPADTALWLQMGQLRATCYVDEHNYLDESLLDENGAEYDEYDKNASHFVVLDDTETILGTARLLYREANSSSPLLPAEKLFDDGIDGLTPSAMEVSRFIINSSAFSDKERHAGKLKTGAHLIRALTQEAEPRDDPAYAVVEPWLLGYLKHIGVPYETIVSKPQHTEKYNSDNILITISYDRMTRSIAENDKSRVVPARLVERGMPERLAPFFEKDRTTRGLGKIALDAFTTMPMEQWDRNLGWISRAEQQRLLESTVAIAGAGGDGGELAITLAQLGIGNFKIADPENFELENLNRQTGANYSTLGRNKAEVIGEMIKDINPFAKVEIYEKGVQADNVSDFVSGCDAVVDETEYTMPELGVMIARAARDHNLPVVMGLNVGFGSYAMSFSPTGRTFESCFGMSDDAPLDEIAATEVAFDKWVSHIPSYSDMNAFEKVASGEVSTPTVAPGVKMVAADASTQVLAHLLAPMSPTRKKWITYAPGGRVLDVIDGSARVSHPRPHFLGSVAKAALRTKLGLNPSAGYDM